MRTVRFEPRSFLESPKEFGKFPSAEWKALADDEALTRARLGAARAHHELATRVEAIGNSTARSKKALAEALDVSTATLGRLLRGEIVMQIDMMYLLAEWTAQEVTLRKTDPLTRETAFLDALDDLVDRRRLELAENRRIARERSRS